MKKLLKVTSTVLAILTVFLTVNVTTVFAAPQKVTADFSVENVSKGVKIKLNSKYKYATYVIYRKNPASNYYEEIKTVKNLSTKTFVDKKVKSGETYKYKVSAISYIVVDTKAKAITRLDTPTNLAVKTDTYKNVWGKDFVVISGLGQEYVDQLLNSKIAVLSWNKVKGAKSYNIYRAKVNGSKVGTYKKINSKVSMLGKTEAVDTSVMSGQSYRYKVQAVKGKYQSTLSKATKTYTFLETPRLGASLTSDYKGIKLSWVVDGYVDKYEIYRKAEGETYKLIKALKGDEILYDKTTCMLNFVDNEVTLGTNYTYYVKMYVSNKSTNSNQVSITFRDVDVIVKVGETDSTYKKYYDEIYNADDMLTPVGVSRDVTFTSADETIATVTKEGVITGITPGETTITMVQSSAPVIPNPEPYTTYTKTKIKVRVTEV